MGEKLRVRKDISYDFVYEIVWAVKYKRQVLVGDISIRLEELIVKHCEESDDMTLINVEIYPSYVWIELEVYPVMGIHKAIKELKALTSSVLRQEFPVLKSKLPTLWDNSYIGRTLGHGLTDSDVCNYLQSRPNSQRKRGGE